MAQIFQAYYKNKNMNNNWDTLNSCIFNKLGIQALPGTKFTINDDDKNILYIGATGIFDLDLGDKIQIQNLKFDEASLEKIAKYNSYIVVDGIIEGNTGRISNGSIKDSDNNNENDVTETSNSNNLHSSPLDDLLNKK